MFEDAAIRYKGSVQLAVVDHISSASATVFPIQKIANKLRPLGVLVLVDGAHAPGQGKYLPFKRARTNDDLFFGKD